MTTAIKRRRGTTVQHSTFTGLDGELTVDTTKKTVVVHDGTTAGGVPLAKETGSVINATSLTSSSDALVNGLTVGRGTSNVSTNTAVGSDALAYHTAAALNSTAVGKNALRSGVTVSAVDIALGATYTIVSVGNTDFTLIGAASNTVGVTFSATGSGAGSGTARVINIGELNTAIGSGALYSNSTGSSNAALGNGALFENTHGHHNTALGAGTLENNITGTYNTAVGYGALHVSDEAHNTAVGASAMNNSTLGFQNTAVGAAAMLANTSGSYNTAVGQSALSGNVLADSNTAIGFSALGATTGALNTAVGRGSGTEITLGSKNTILGPYTGNQGGLDIRTANNYIVLSDGDGNPRQVIDSSGNLLVGKTVADYTTTGVYISSGIVNSAGTTDYWNSYSTSAGAYRFYVTSAGTITATNTSISAISDQRLKENIQDIDAGLDKIMALKPRKFDWKAGKGKDIKNDRGFIAQEFEQVFPDLIDEWKDPAPEGEEPYKSVRQDLIPVLVKAIQEQQALIESLKARLDAANL